MNQCQGTEKEKIWRCSQLNYSGLPKSYVSRLKAGGQLTKDYSHSGDICRNFGFISRWLFPRIILAWHHRTAGASTSCHTWHGLSRPLPTANPQEDTSLCPRCAYPSAGPASLSPILLSAANVNSFRQLTSFFPLPLTRCIKMLANSKKMGTLSFLSSHAAGGSDSMPQD